MPAYTINTRTAYKPMHTFMVYTSCLEAHIKVCKAKMLEDEMILRIEILCDRKVVWDSSAEPTKSDIMVQHGAVNIPATVMDPKDLFGYPTPGPKPRYKINQPTIVPGNTPGNFVAYGYRVLGDDEENESIRTSKIIKIDIEAGTIETLNSIYEIV